MQHYSERAITFKAKRKMSKEALPSGTSAGMALTEEASARTLILALIYRYASVAREDGDYSQIMKLFETNATIRFPDGRELSPSNLGEITRDNPPKLLRHHLTTIDIQFLFRTKHTVRAMSLLGLILRCLIIGAVGMIL